ncbi:NAD(P)-dependent alcohol dehydrogenase [Rhizobium sp. CF142]|uniref:NAD(P)-dependent alcohol dehydrogenase n=1 Tax=Rhizobium sp. CF142 TaxID=1144314 RepID=UPI00026EFEDE|nr:NAD(P)-dependent alcohol dehydrogenase [Rhizobium sp. CF142]EJJ29266.1 Zn-dependent alcohol dehydrogenase [Rhizobium sp. CF142]
MILSHARCVCGPQSRFEATMIERRDLGDADVLIDIAYAGICHSDIDHARATRGKSVYPMVPGHEIAGVVSAVGSNVTRFSVGDRVGVGNLVDSCRTCSRCQSGQEQYCASRVLTYNQLGRDGRMTEGGYSEKIVVDERFVVRIPDAIPLANAAPLFCAGITLYSPLRNWGAGPGKRVAIIGLGGLGHLGVQISKALGAHTTVLELDGTKRQDALRLGAQCFRVTRDTASLRELASSFDLIISTVPANIDLDAYLALLDVGGTFVNLSIPEKPLSVAAAVLLANRRSLSGTLSGGLPETQEMIDFCAANNINAEVEIIGADEIDEAFERLAAGNVRYRFVIDAATIAQQPK